MRQSVKGTDVCYFFQILNCTGLKPKVWEHSRLMTKHRWPLLNRNLKRQVHLFKSKLIDCLLYTGIGCLTGECSEENCEVWNPISHRIEIRLCDNDTATYLCQTVDGPGRVAIYLHQQLMLNVFQLLCLGFNLWASTLDFHKVSDRFLKYMTYLSCYQIIALSNLNLNSNIQLLL